MCCVSTNSLFHIFFLKERWRNDEIFAESCDKQLQPLSQFGIICVLSANLIVFKEHANK